MSAPYQTFIQIIIISLASAQLSACSATNGDDGTDETEIVDVIDTSFEDLLTVATAAGSDAIEIYHEGFTPEGALPTTGSAIYNGYVNSWHNERDDDGVLTHVTDTIGEVSLSASFADNDISGRIYNLSSAETGKIGGELTGTGDISQVFGGNIFDMDMSGTLVIDGARGDYTGEMDGTFYGEDGDLVMINVEGELDFDDDEVEDFDLVGFAVAE